MQKALKKESSEALFESLEAEKLKRDKSLLAELTENTAAVPAAVADYRIRIGLAKEWEKAVQAVFRERVYQER